jgi:hypothetical protein
VKGAERVGEYHSGMFRTTRHAGKPPFAAQPHDVPILLSNDGLAAFMLAQLADLVTFLVMIDVRGVTAELNPVAATMLDMHHLALLVVAKVASWSLIIASVALLARRTPRVAQLIMLVGIAAGLLGAVSNLLTL